VVSSVQVGESPTAGVEEVTFLYQLAEGACPKSYGTNVAKLAGMPDAVLARAAAKSAEVERTSDELTAGSSKKSAGDESEPPLDALEKELFDRLAASLKGSARPGAGRELVEVWQEAKRASVESPQLAKRRRVEGEEPIGRTAGVA
jgi:DNA mismatch repair ATPase MutS